MAEDLPRLGTLWHDGWHEVLAYLAPSGLVAARTPDDFRERLLAIRARTRVFGAEFAPREFCMIYVDELEHLLSVRQRGDRG